MKSLSIHAVVDDIRRRRIAAERKLASQLASIKVKPATQVFPLIFR